MDFKNEDNIVVIYSKSNESLLEYEGILFKDDMFKEFLKEVVSPSITDTKYNEKLRTLAIEMTGFETDNLNHIFANRPRITNWRIGEILAEEIVASRYNARFFYNSDRDLKNLNSNQTGADLVGFIELDNGAVQFLFGEVKTSSENNVPPGVMYSETGMIEQLKGLANSDSKKAMLVKWLFIKCSTCQDGIVKSDIKKAITNYVQDKNICLIGVLVRDTSPDENDLKARSKNLHNDIKCKEVRTQLLAVYTNCEMKDGAWKKCI